MSNKIPIKNIEPGIEKLEVYGESSQKGNVSKTIELYESRKKIYVKKLF